MKTKLLSHFFKQVSSTTITGALLTISSFVSSAPTHQPATMDEAANSFLHPKTYEEPFKASNQGMEDLSDKNNSHACFDKVSESMSLEEVKKRFFVGKRSSDDQNNADVCKSCDHDFRCHNISGECKTKCPAYMVDDMMHHVETYQRGNFWERRQTPEEMAFEISISEIQACIAHSVETILRGGSRYGLDEPQSKESHVSLPVIYKSPFFDSDFTGQRKNQVFNNMMVKYLPLTKETLYKPYLAAKEFCLKTNPEYLRKFPYLAYNLEMYYRDSDDPSHDSIELCRTRTRGELSNNEDLPFYSSLVTMYATTNDDFDSNLESLISAMCQHAGQKEKGHQSSAITQCSELASIELRGSSVIEYNNIKHSLLDIENSTVRLTDLSQIGQDKYSGSLTIKIDSDSHSPEIRDGAAMEELILNTFRKDESHGAIADHAKVTLQCREHDGIVELKLDIDDSSELRLASPLSGAIRSGWTPPHNTYLGAQYNEFTLQSNLQEFRFMLTKYRASTEY